MQSNAPNELFRTLISKDFEVKTLSSIGKEVTDIEEAEMFSFDFEANGNNYGTVVILLNSDSQLELFYGDNIGKSMEPNDKKAWMDFLYQLRMFAKRNLLGFKLNDLSKLKYSMQGMAAIKEGLFEGYYGTKKTSYSPQGKAKIIIKHSRPIGEGEKRYYNIESLFVENADGERFKLPFTKLAGARAMARHVTEGGNPYDVFGVHIAEMVKEAGTLAGFVRRSKMFEEDEETGQYVMAGKEYYQSLRKKLKSISGKRGYHMYKEQWSPADISEEELNVDNIRRLFTEKTVNSQIDEALPLLARIAAGSAVKSMVSNDDDEVEEMQEVGEFSQWADKVAEGTWAAPDNDEAKEQLQDFLAQPQPVGIDALDASDKLYDIIGDDELFDNLADLADKDPEADARPLVIQWLENNLPDMVTSVDVDEVPTEEGLSHDLDADNETQLNASINKHVEKHVDEDQAYSVNYDLDRLSLELRNAIADDLVSVYDLLGNTIGFKPGKKEMQILQRAFNEIQIDMHLHPDDDYDEICNAMTEIIQDLQDGNESVDPDKEAIRESMDALSKMGPGILTNELEDLIRRTHSILKN